jgi:hypothetical protein
MWPREVFHRLAETKKGGSKGRKSAPKQMYKEISLLTKPGVYVLYRDTEPYYIGQAKKLRLRLYEHACRADTRYYNFWNFFSAFVVEDSETRNEIEGILIASMPTANSMRPRIKKESLPLPVKKMIREIEWPLPVKKMIREIEWKRANPSH